MLNGLVQSNYKKKQTNEMCQLVFYDFSLK
jgi:hypothetical protein